MELLAPCPLCHSHEVTGRKVNIDGKLMDAVSCKDCGLIGPAFFPNQSGKLSSTDLAITLWNDRADSI